MSHADPTTPSPEQMEKSMSQAWEDEDRHDAKQIDAVALREGMATLQREAEKKKRAEEAAAVKEELDEWSSASILSRKWKIGLGCVLAGFLTSAVLLWLTATNEFLARMQTFNGALTIPVGALTWAFAFTFVFLVPMKAMQILMCRVMKYNIEVSERMLDVLESADEQIQERAERMETRYNNVLGKLERFVDELDSGEHKLIGRFEDAIRGAREETEEELDDALRAGEAEAAALSAGTQEVDFEVLYELAPWPSEEKRYPVRAVTENDAYRMATHALCFKHGAENVRFPKEGAVVRARTATTQEGA